MSAMGIVLANIFIHFRCVRHGGNPCKHYRLSSLELCLFPLRYLRRLVPHSRWAAVVRTAIAMDGASASGAVKIKTGACAELAIQPRVLTMGHCAVTGELAPLTGLLFVKSASRR